MVLLVRSCLKGDANKERKGLFGEIEVAVGSPLISWDLKNRGLKMGDGGNGCFRLGRYLVGFDILQVEIVLNCAFLFVVSEKCLFEFHQFIRFRYFGT